MTEGKEIMVHEGAPNDGALMVRTLDDVQRVATACAQSGFFRDVKEASQAVVKIIAGREMGVGAIRALAEVHIIEGKPTAGASLIAAFVKRSGRYDYRVVSSSNEAAEIAWFEKGQEVGRTRWTTEDAERAGLAGKGNWRKHPRAMLFHRALTEGVRMYCPDVAGGVKYTPEELAPDVPVDEDGRPLDGQPPPIRDVNPAPPAPPAAKDATDGKPPKRRTRKSADKAPPPEPPAPEPEPAAEAAATPPDEPQPGTINGLERQTLVDAVNAKLAELQGIAGTDFITKERMFDMVKRILADYNVAKTRDLPSEHLNPVMGAVRSLQVEDFTGEAPPDDEV